MKVYIVTQEWFMDGERESNILGAYATRDLAQQRVAEEKKNIKRDWDVDDLEGWDEETDVPGCYELNRDDYEYQFSCWIEEKEIIGL